MSLRIKGSRPADNSAVRKETTTGTTAGRSHARTVVTPAPTQTPLSPRRARLFFGTPLKPLHELAADTALKSPTARRVTENGADARPAHTSSVYDTFAADGENERAHNSNNAEIDLTDSRGERVHTTTPSQQMPTTSKRQPVRVTTEAGDQQNEHVDDSLGYGIRTAPRVAGPSKLTTNVVRDRYLSYPVQKRGIFWFRRQTILHRRRLRSRGT